MNDRVKEVIKAAKTVKNVFRIDSENILHVSLKELTRGSGCTCRCAIGCSVDDLECFARELMDIFEAKSVVIHDEYRPKNTIHVVEVPPGTQEHLEKFNRNIDSCAIHPIITGILDWKHENDTQDFLK
jgi:hypothetical protein